MLHLTAEQRQQLLLQRTAHLALMRRIYRQRQQLNMQVSHTRCLTRAASLPDQVLQSLARVLVCQSAENPASELPASSSNA